MLDTMACLMIAVTTYSHGLEKMQLRVNWPPKITMVSASRGKIHITYFSVCHAEMNAIMNKTSADVNNCTIFVSLFPCNECAKLIIQAGIKEVVYLREKIPEEDIYIASKRLLDMAEIQYR